MRSGRPPSLVAERAVRYLAERREPATSIELADEILRTRVGAEEAARQVLEAAFGGDPRLAYERGLWNRVDAPRASAPPEEAPEVETEPEPEPEPDRLLLVLKGARRARGAPFELDSVAAVRLRGEGVMLACAGRRLAGPAGERLRREVSRALGGAIPVLHDPPGALAAFERWLGDVLDEPISVRRLAQARLGSRADEELGALASRLELHQTGSDDPLEEVGVLDACLSALKRSKETLDDLRQSLRPASPPIDWSRFAFDRAVLDSLPEAPGTYRFFDADGNLLYVGKAKNLSRRVSSYFREGTRTRRVERLLATLHRIEIEESGSDLEAILREAAAIARSKPEKNVQRQTVVRGGRSERLRSILILEPAAPPFVLRAYLVRDGKLLGRVPLGPKGGGVRRVERLLEDRFFSYRPGPSGEDAIAVDVELIARWLASHRDSVVALDPTHFETAGDVAEKLRWFLARGGLVDPDGAPIHVR